MNIFFFWKNIVYNDLINSVLVGSVILNIYIYIFMNIRSLLTETNSNFTNNSNPNGGSRISTWWCSKLRFRCSCWIFFLFPYLLLSFLMAVGERSLRNTALTVHMCKGQQLRAQVNSSTRSDRAFSATPRFQPPSSSSVCTHGLTTAHFRLFAIFFGLACN